MPNARPTLRTCRRGHKFRKSSDCPVCPKCAAEEKKRLASDEFPTKLAAPALRALDRAGIKTLAQLAKRSEAEIAEFHGMGPKSMAQLKALMRLFGLSFR